MDPYQGAVGVPVHVTVLRGNNLFQRGNKNEPFLNFVRAEFNGTQLGDSQKCDAAVDESVNYNFFCSFECSESAHTLDDLAQKPVILTVIEILPKEKKQKEEKTCVLGQAVVDLLPLLHGKCSFSSTVVLHPLPGLPTEIDSLDRGIKPTLEVMVSVQEPLLSDAQLSESNLLTVTVETAFSVPEVWSPGPPSSYVAAMQVPLMAEREQILLFSDGVLKMSGEREPVPRPKKWPLGPLLAPDAQFIPGVYIESEPSDLEDGDLNSEEDREFRAEAECNRKRVSWDTEHRCFMDAEGAACLTRRIIECRWWPVEIMRAPQAGGAKLGAGKAGKDKPQAEDEIQIPFHGVAYVDLAPLLYPGVKHIHGAYYLHPFYDSDLFMKTKRTKSVLRESIRAPAAQGRPRPPSSMSSCKATPSKVIDTQRGGKDNREAPKKTGTQGKPAQAESLIDVELQMNAEGQMYADSRSYIIIEITLEKPLIPKRPPEELAKRVMELIPTRPSLPRCPVGAERAVQEYKAQIASVAAQVLEEYQQMFGAAFVAGAEPLDPTTQEQRKSQLFGELNCSGKYFAFKEQMKYSVVRIVREKMLRTEAFTEPEQLQAFLSQLYIFLVDEMHVALNKTLTADVQEVQAQPLLDCAQLIHFAREAELNGDYKLAAHYYKERLARDRSNPSHWFDYGVFYMLTTDYSKAEECFRTAVSIDQSHVSSLLMCGILSEMNEQYEEAGTFLEGATCIDPSSVIAWTLFGLFYLAQENFIQAEMAFQEATKQLRAPLQKSPVCGPDPTGNTSSPAQDEEKEEVGTTESPTDQEHKPAVEVLGETEEARIQTSHVIQPEEGDKVNADDKATVLQHNTTTRLNTTIYMVTVKFLLRNYALQMAQRALAQELLCPDGGPSSSYHLALAHVQLLRGEYSNAGASLQEALSDNIQNPDIWALYGHWYYLVKDYHQAQKCYERTLDFVTDASDTHHIYIRLGSIYLQSGEYEKAKPIYLRACGSSPSCFTWLGLGSACYRLGELAEAEDALTEANILDNGNPEVWGYLSLVCLKTGRKVEAEQSYKYALKFNLPEEPLLQEIKELQAHVGFGNPCFR
ncbi:cilia- and flagella-associated protein 70 [Electrophorus electricus]|uniref:cilia- and flagella-associated protein 70 n=1 Tax=Electrophorus electricus TaxID=8005 RepID=UPI0015D0AE48|nr:cilia- and flagella-associated protein 70 [Electrophorus electricus]